MGWDLEIYGMCVMLNINIILYIKGDLYYILYFKFQNREIQNENIDILFINNNHFDLLLNKIYKYDLSYISENIIFKCRNSNNNKIKKQRKLIINQFI